MSDRSSKHGNRIARAMHKKLREVSPRIRVLFCVAAVVALALTVVAIGVMWLLLSTYAQVGTISATYDRSERAAQELMDTSDYLTSQVREYVSTGNRQFMDNYLAELYTIDRRGSALDILRENSTNDEATTALEKALAHSDELAQTELRAMRLTADANHLHDQPSAITDVQLSAEEEALTPDDKLARAQELVFGDEYNDQKFSIRERVQSCSSILVGILRTDLEQSNKTINRQLGTMLASIVMLLVVILFIILSTSFLLLWPISLHEKSLRKDAPLEPIGARELRHLTAAYNEMYEINHNKTEALQYEAKNDALTGILNRASYISLLATHRHSCALILVDVDDFKSFNDNYGHEMGDAVLIEVAATLYKSFRQDDYVCRIGGDEFAVIMENTGQELQDVVARKMESVAEFLRDTSNGLPSVTISVGVAFGSPDMPEEGLFNAADTALYATKRSGRDGYTFYGDLKKD